MRALARIGASAALALLLQRSADAFQVETSVTHGCHERITLGALEAAGWPDGRTAPPPSPDEARWIDDLPFTVPDGAGAWTAALLVGARFNDVHGFAPTHLADLVHIHNDPDDQPAHCMRRAQDDGPAGDAAAMTACRVFILGELAAALGPGDVIDLEVTDPVPVFLAFRGPMQLELSRFAFHAGRALHALQDGYTHSFRAPADGRVRHVLNWIEFARSPSYDPERDGFQHIMELDDCTRDSEPMRRRVARAGEASRRLLAAIADGEGGRAGRLARAAAVLDEVMAVEPGCVADNDYCEAPELAEMTGCSTTGGRGGLAGALVVACAVALARRPRGGGRGAGCAVALLLAAQGAAAADPAGGRFALHAGTAGAMDRGALAFSLGARYRLTSFMSVGLDVEHNPWFSVDAGRFEPGTINAYGTVIYRHRAIGGWELRSSLSVGTSVLLFDMVGVDEGSVGLYVGASPLGVAIPVGGGAKLVFEPASIAMPTPLLSGMPFFYRQYRCAVGVEWTLGARRRPR